MREIRVGVTGLVALVDEIDFDRVSLFRWCKAERGAVTYAVRWVKMPDGRRTPIYLHSYVTGWSRVDHRNHDGLDNRRENLRPATHSQNMANRRGPRPLKGVRRRSRAGRARWEAYCGPRGEYGYLGVYDTAEEAGRAYDRRARELYGEFAYLNFTGVDDAEH